MAQNEFIRNNAAPDGIHDNIEFNEWHNVKWWTERALRKDLLDRLMPFAIVAGALLGFCLVGIIEMAR